MRKTLIIIPLRYTIEKMQPFKEELLHYIWKTRRIDYNNLKTTDGKNIKIQSWGNHNHDAGPDFSHAVISIDGIIWSGNVEMHVFSSQWRKHRHHLDKAYDNVILHVVYEHDDEVYRTSGKTIPTLELKTLIDRKLINRYLQLMQKESWIPCEKIIHTFPKEKAPMWLSSLLIQRLESKVTVLKSIHESTSKDWEQTAFILLSKYMGAKVNQQPMEMMARSLDVKIIYKNKDNITAIEALLYGQAGLLKYAKDTDPYILTLKQHYKLFQKKYNLTPIDPVAWKLSKLRPANFPHIRLSQLAYILYTNNHFFSLLLTDTDLKNLPQLLKSSASKYWDTHYTFGKESTSKKKNMGKSFIEMLLINVVAPLSFYYGVSIDNNDYKNRGIQLLESIKGENNQVIKKWSHLGLPTTYASDTQALLQLKNEYCKNKKCLHCQIGNFLLKENA